MSTKLTLNQGPGEDALSEHDQAYLAALTGGEVDEAPGEVMVLRRRKVTETWEDSGPGSDSECAGADEGESPGDNPLPTPPRLDQLFQYRNLHRCSTSQLLSAADRKLQNTPFARGASEIAACSTPNAEK